MGEQDKDYLRDHLKALKNSDWQTAERLRDDIAQQGDELSGLEARGDALYYAGEMQAAIDLYETVIKKNPEKILPRYQLLAGLQDEGNKRLTDAFDRYQAAIEAEPEFVDAYLRMGELLLKVEDLDGALHCFKDAARLTPGESEVQQKVLLTVRRMAEADPGTYAGLLRELEQLFKPQ